MASAAKDPRSLVGTTVKFKGYTEEVEEPVFKPGDELEIVSINEADEALQARPLSGGVLATVFMDELDETTFPAVEAEAEPEAQLKVAAASSKIARKTEAKPKAKAKAPAKVAAKPAKKVEAKAPSKSVEKRLAVQKAPPKVEAKPKAAVAKAAVKPVAKITRKGKAAVRDEQTVDLVDKVDGERAAELAAKVETVAVQPWEDTPNVPALAIATGVTTELGAVSDSERVAGILAAQDALQAAKDLVAQAEETYFTLGGVLSHIYYEGIHKTLGYDGKRGFEEYTEKELGVAYRKAMYLIDIYTTFRRVGFDERRLTQIGWSKAKELTRFVTVDNVEDLVAAATEKSREELTTYLRESRATAEGGTAGETARRVKINFALFADQAETVTRALDEAKGKVGNDNLNQALEYICAEWLLANEGVDLPLEDAIRFIETKYGVRLVPQSAAVDVPVEQLEGHA